MQPGEEWGHCGINWPTEVVRTATLLEFYEKDRFLTASCGPYMSHSLKLFYTFHLKNKKKLWFLRKLFEVRIKLHKPLKD
jgi:hypothetical protein